jgi:alkane 1-monooxygenase
MEDRFSASAAKYLPYLLPHLLLSGIVAGVLVYGAQAYAFIALAWLAFAALDSALYAPDGRPFQVAHAANREDLVWRLLVYAMVPLYFAFLSSGLLFVAAEPRTLREFALATAVVGFVGAVFAMPVAHELMHGRRRWERRLAVALMIAFSYPHFCIEHTSGHHRNVGTVLDPATARHGEGFYAFFLRVVSWSLINSWFVEAERLHRRGVAVVGPHNRLLRYLALLVAVYLLVGCLTGWAGLLFFAAQGIIAFSTLEAINYIQHYGLTRGRSESGRLEPVGRMHSWDCYHHLSNWCLFNLPLHSDHHMGGSASPMKAVAPEGAPRLPLGYFVLLWLAFFPPLWRAVMDPYVARWRGGEGDTLPAGYGKASAGASD